MTNKQTEKIESCRNCKMPDNLPGSTWDGDPAAPWNRPEPVCGTCDYWFDVGGGICIYPAVEEDRIEIEPHPATDPDCGFWRRGWEQEER